MATLSVLGLLKADEHIFDDFHVPDGVDKNTLTSNIIAECAELEVLYPNPKIFKYILGNWSFARVGAWDRVFKALAAEYSPLENTDKYEETTLGPVENAGKRYNATYDGPEIQTERIENTSKSVVNSVHAHGNIGVTTNQHMIGEEIELRKKDIYAIIVQDFKSMFTLQVY